MKLRSPDPCGLPGSMGKSHRSRGPFLQTVIAMNGGGEGGEVRAAQCTGHMTR